MSGIKHKFAVRVMVKIMMIGRSGSPTGNQTDRRWIVLGSDGRYVSLGKASDPSPEEIRGTETALKEQGSSGWLAVMDGSPWGKSLPTLMEVKPLADPAGSFGEAAERCLARIKAERAPVLGKPL